MDNLQQDRTYLKIQKDQALIKEVSFTKIWKV